LPAWLASFDRAGFEGGEDGTAFTTIADSAGKWSFSAYSA
jgi:hypothetical protein